MKVLVIGFGISGRSAAKFLLNRGQKVAAIDQRAEELKSDPQVAALLERGVSLSESDSPENLAQFDLIVVSPGVPSSHPVVVEALKQKIEVIGEVELACRSLRQPMIAVTGTNGKTTVTQLIGHVLNMCGKPAKVLGNGGVPLAAEADDLQDEIVVCELSSYQLETLRCQVIDAGAILNISPDHLDRYPDMEAYAKAKLGMASCMKPGKTLYLSKQVLTDFGHLIIGNKECIELFNEDGYKSGFTHDEENKLAAKRLCMGFGVASEEFDEAEKLFKKPPHRIEFVRKRKGVSYFNDSKGTNLDAVRRAVERMEGPVILIAGGKEKGVSFTPWIDSFRGKVKKIIAIGEAKSTLIKELGQDFDISEKPDLGSAVLTASSIANDGDNVLLSPGCASFDMFRNFEDRGNHFKECVQLLD